MHSIPVELGHRSYQIIVQPGLLSSLYAFLDEWNHGQTWLMVTQPSLYEQFGRDLEANLTHHGYNVRSLTIPAGESAKSLEQVKELYQHMIHMSCDRSTTILALGGGVVGDVAGFIAATFMRGTDYIQIPTTLLSMVDSAIGGKTGVNLPEGKNLVGAIHQPKLVAVDTVTLQTLPKRELISGLAEVLKYGAIGDRDFFGMVSENIASFIDQENDALIEDIIALSCEIKSRIVSSDEHESGLRRILNFGHTVGHAFETLLGFEKLRHGEAVAYGMLCAGYISHERGLLSPTDWEQLEKTIKQLPLPEFSCPEISELLAIIRRDKKVRAGVLHFVLLESLGNAVIADDVTDQEITEAVHATIPA